MTGEYVRNVKWLEVLGQRLDRGGNKRTEGGMSGGKRHGGVGGGGGVQCILLPAACPENKQTSDYDINAS